MPWKGRFIMKDILQMLQDPAILPVVYILAFLWGVVFGSFINVLILRIPKKESIIKPSHCVTCNHKLAWYDNIPILSWLFLRGKCRYCKAKISIQYPIIEFVNGLLFVFVLWINGVSIDSVLIAAMSSALLSLSVADWRTYEIANGYHVFIIALAIIRLVTGGIAWLDALIGFFAVSLLLLAIYLISGGRAIGGGDVKLMAACGMFIGWKPVILALFIGCVVGSIIHIARMKISKNVNHVLAMGPYLSIGVFIASLYGNAIINWYIGFLTQA